MHGRGMPTEKNITDLKTWCTIDGKVDMELLRAITGMMNGRGMPTEKNITDLKTWCTIDGKVDMELLRAITGMMCGRGIAEEKDVKRFIELLKAKYGDKWHDNISSESGKYASR